MSIARALSNAVSGLAATSRGTEIVAANVANVMTPGYGRREMTVSAQALGATSGGVRVLGIDRVVNAAVLGEARLSYAARGGANDLAAFFNTIEDVVGLPGEQASISTAMTEFRAALISASARPDDQLRLSNVAEKAMSIADRLNAAARTVQEARTAADVSISNQVERLQDGLERVTQLNRQIMSIGPGGRDTSALYDERQSIIDQMSDIVPLRVIEREAGRVSIFTAEGAVLLDGTRPASLSFTPAGQFTPEMQIGMAGVGGLVFNDEELSGNMLRMFQGGTLGAAFAIRDELAPQVQAELDALAYELVDRFADPSIDATLSPGDAGLFTDAGGAATLATSTGLAARFSVNSAILPEQGGDLWRIRSGLNATAQGPVGDSSLVERLSGALTAVRAMSGPSSLDGNYDMPGFFAKFEAAIATRRISSEADATLHDTRASNLTERLMAEGVDTDAEMQRLLQYEQAYAANARVIQAIDEMMMTILRV